MNRASIPPRCQREPSRGSAVWGNPSYYRRFRRRMYCRGRQSGATMVSNMQHASRSASRSEPRRKCLFLAMIPILTWSCARLLHRGEFGGGWIKCRTRACSARVLAAAALVVLGVGALGSIVEGQESGGGVPEAPLPASVPSTDPTPVPVGGGVVRSDERCQWPIRGGDRVCPSGERFRVGGDQCHQRKCSEPDRLRC